MSQFGAPFAIEKGDVVKIKARGIIVTGIAHSANWWGEEDGWFIEMIKANVPGGYSYWKQGPDGGRVLTVNGIDVK